MAEDRPKQEKVKGEKRKLKKKSTALIPRSLPLISFRWSHSLCSFWHFFRKSAQKAAKNELAGACPELAEGLEQHFWPERIKK
ncbi:MAG TPA: hypothetical protein VJB10_01690 [Candidatus Peribacteraceae bacterium]|nr:hypothetical protein [Candidatus Peribacteraceae bacterium]